MAADSDDGNAEKLLLGIGLCSEVNIRKIEHDVSLGAIMISNKCKLHDLRQCIAQQLPAVPTNFCFVTEHGWSINKSEEGAICIKQVITAESSIRLQRLFDKPRVGVRLSNGDPLGFVFIEHDCLVNHLRDAINMQLDYAISTGNVLYQFLDRNSWPISSSQEKKLTVVEVLINGCVMVVPHIKPQFKPHLKLPSFSEKQLPSENDDVPSNMSSIKQLTFNSSKDQERRISLADTSDSGEDSKQILISYVRAEAAQHALNLKQELLDLGYSVYLDVHEIKSGNDWQDSLNYAVSDCEVFIPIVTPRYGETQWTNREVKLADVLQKLIIPVNFLDHWPPRCLAIQFATTQYVAWKTMNSLLEEEEEGDGERVLDIRFWDQHHICKAAVCIAEQINNYLESETTNSDKFVSPDKTRLPFKRKRSSNLDNYQAFCNGFPLSQISSSSDALSSIVVSVHPLQHQFGQELKQFLEADGYSVWCSSEMYDQNRNSEMSAISDTLSGSETLTDDELKHVTKGSRKLSLRRLKSSDSFSDLCLSQGMSSQVSNELDLAEMETQRTFQEKVDKASVIIFVLSKAFSASKISKQQVFYCEHRKRFIPLRYEEFCMPGWMSMLIGTGVFEDVKYDSYKERVKKRLKHILSPFDTFHESLEVDEANIAIQASRLRKLLPPKKCIYISGGTKFFHKNSSDICKAIGESLAQFDDIHLITGGFYGVGETIARAFFQKRKEMGKLENVWHILPEKDSVERSHQARQNSDKTFQVLPYGTTIFSGNSVREREIIVARVIDICILIEGGPGAAHEAEQFVWNDHFVIPIVCTGGAAGGKFNVPRKIFEIPTSVMENDWHILQNNNSSCYEIAKSLVNAVQCLHEKLQIDLGLCASTDLERGDGRKRKKPSLTKKRSNLTRNSTVILKPETELN